MWTAVEIRRRLHKKYGVSSGVIRDCIRISRRLLPSRTSTVKHTSSSSVVVNTKNKKENDYIYYHADERSDAVGREYERLPDKQHSHSVYARAAGRRATESARSLFDFVYYSHAFKRHRNIHTRQTIPNSDALHQNVGWVGRYSNAKR